MFQIKANKSISTYMKCVGIGGCYEQVSTFWRWSWGNHLAIWFLRIWCRNPWLISKRPPGLYFSSWASSSLNISISTYSYSKMTEFFPLMCTPIRGQKANQCMLADLNLWSNYTLPEFKLDGTMRHTYFKTLHSDPYGNEHISHDVKILWHNR